MGKFSNWFKKVKDKEDFDERKDYSNIGSDSTNQNYDLSAAGAGVIPNILGTNAYGTFGSSYGGYFTSQGANTYPLWGMHSMARMYQWMSQDPDIRFAVDEISNEATMTKSGEDIVYLKMDKLEIGEDTKKKIEESFQKVLNLMDFNNTAHYHFSSFYINGRVFYKADIDKDHIDKGITAIKQIIPFDVIAYFDNEYHSLPSKVMDRLTIKEGYILTEDSFRNSQGIGLSRSFRDGLKKTSNEFIAVPKELIIYQHSGLVDWRYNIPISYLHLVLKTLNQVRTLMDAMIIYRMTRAPERYVFNVEVGQMQTTKVEEYIAKVANRLKQNIMYDPETGKIKDENDKLSIYKDWFFPQVNGTGTDVDVLQAGNMIGQLEEIEAMQKILFRQLFIPYNRYTQEGSTVNFGNASEIEHSEMKFHRHIQKLQKQYNSVLFDLLRLELSLSGKMDFEKFEEIKSDINIVWDSENIYQETKEIGILNRRAEALREFEAYSGRFGITDKWIAETILDIDEDDYKERLKETKEELIRSSYIDQIKNGEIKFDEKGHKMIKIDGEFYTEEEVKKKEKEGKAEETEETEETEGSL